MDKGSLQALTSFSTCSAKASSRLQAPEQSMHCHRSRDLSAKASGLQRVMDLAQEGRRARSRFCSAGLVLSHVPMRSTTSTFGDQNPRPQAASPTVGISCVDSTDSDKLRSPVICLLTSAMTVPCAFSRIPSTKLMLAMDHMFPASALVWGSL